MAMCVYFRTCGFRHLFVAFVPFPVYFGSIREQSILIGDKMDQKEPKGIVRNRNEPIATGAKGSKR